VSRRLVRIDSRAGGRRGSIHGRSLPFAGVVSRRGKPAQLAWSA